MSWHKELLIEPDEPRFLATVTGHTSVDPAPILDVNLCQLLPTIMDKSLGTLLRFWGVFQFTQVQPLPSPHKQCWTRVSRILSEIQLCIGWGEGELQENFENDAVLRGSREMTRKYAYCSTVPRTFVHDCSTYNKKILFYRHLTQDYLKSSSSEYLWYSQS